jgi:cell division inhibitor SulA
LIEMVCAHPGIGELQILLPLLRERSQQAASILWIAPPYSLNSPAFQQAGVNTRNSFVIPPQTSCNQALWSIEKALQSSECGLVLAWQNWLSARVIRRLQLAASEGNTLGVLFHKRPTANSPASLQLHLRSPIANISQRQHARAIEVSLTRARGSYRQGRVTLPLP